jgi:hypothetical protein
MSAKSSQPVEDFLDEDNDIPSQKYVLLSFLSPERVLEKKDLFFFEQFLKNYEIEWKSKNLEKFLAETVVTVNRELDENAVELEKKNMFDQAEICRKNRVGIETVMDNYQKFITKNKKDLNSSQILEAYRDFLFKHQNRLEEEYHAKNDFHTSMRGVKVRGVYSTSKEAEARGKKLQQKDKYFNIFIGEVGKWLPWDPEPHQVQEQEYAEDQLNTLMKKYKENEDGKERFFEERRKQDGNSARVAPKQIFGSNTEESVSDATGGMFDLVGDLALQRRVKKEAEKNGSVDDNNSAVNNIVISPATDDDVARADVARADV